MRCNVQSMRRKNRPRPYVNHYKRSGPAGHGFIRGSLQFLLELDDLG